MTKALDWDVLEALRRVEEEAVFFPASGPCVLWGPGAERNAEALRGMGVPCLVLEEPAVKEGE